MQSDSVKFKTTLFSLLSCSFALFVFSFSLASAQTLTIGDSTILPQPDNGNGNLLVAQSATLSQIATIQSLSFYITTAAGNLRLGIYDATGPSGGPGQKRAETNEITTVVGWNTAPVTSPVSLSAGTYWLAYLPSSNTLAFVKTQDGSSSGRHYSYTYGTMPQTFLTTPNTTASHWSFYATLSTTPAETTPPSVSITAPASGSTVSGSAVTVSTNASDNVGVVGVQFKLDGTNLGSEDTTGPYSITWNSTIASNGSHTLTATARDAAGNTTTSSGVTVTVNNVAPPPDTQAPTAPTNLSATAVSSSQINLSWTASTDNVGVTGYRVERCQGLTCTNFVQIATPPPAGGTNSYSDTGLTANTTYRYQVRTTDAANNLSTYSSIASGTTQTAPLPGSSALATLAASMAPGEWRELVTNNIDVLRDNGTDGSIISFSNDAAWDPNSQKLLYIGNDHIDGNGNEDIHFVIYDATTNTWQNMPPPWSSPGRTDHGYDHHAIDAATGTFYRRHFKEGRDFYRYDISRNNWSILPDNNLIGYASCCGGVDYFPELGGLILAQGGDFGGGRVFLFRESTSAWEELARNLPIGVYHNHGVYNPVHKVMLFGGGNNATRKIYKLNSSGAVIPLLDAPADLRISSSILTVDPASGDYLLFTAGKSLYRYDIVNDVWQLQTTSVPIWHPGSNGVVDIAATPIPEYGVVMTISCITGTCRVHLYKHASGSTPLPSDTTAPATTVTAPSAGTTVVNTVSISANASDNVGVTNVEFLVDGVAKGSDASSPYSYSWDTTNGGIHPCNGTHTHILVTRAYDAAGNMGTSANVVVNMNNPSYCTTPPPSTKFVIGDRVQVSSGPLNVRSTPSTSGTLLGTQAINALGTVTGGPTAADGYHWWNINYDNAPDGWGVEDFLVKYMPPSGGSDFSTRCSAAGVVKCVGFDQVADIQGTYGDNHGIFPGAATPALDSAVKASGNSALKFTIPTNSGTNTSGSYFTNFSDDLSVQFGENSEFYLQWRQRFSPEMLSTNYTGSNGWKQMAVTTGDKPGQLYNSCEAIGVTMENSGLRGFAQMYQSCTGSTSHGPYDPLTRYTTLPAPYSRDDILLQNARIAPYCTYLQQWSLGTPTAFPPGNCFIYYPNEWMTFQVSVKTGPRVNDEFTNSYIRVWIAREGQPSQTVFDFGPYNISASSATENQRYGKIWFLPYQTNKDSTQIHPSAYTWYDELIISHNRIADPSTSVTQPLLGDLNLDRTVNGTDWTIMLGQWFTASQPSDINLDGVVNSIDFSLMNANWGRTI